MHLTTCTGAHCQAFRRLTFCPAISSFVSPLSEHIVRGSLEHAIHTRILADFLHASSSITAVPAATAPTLAHAAALPGAPIERRALAADFLSALGGGAMAHSPTKSAPQPFVPDAATASALAALRRSSEAHYSATSCGSVVAGTGHRPAVAGLAAD
eukprot:scaffold21547_cov111-Isochrysis_galbana.AAC.1